LYKFNKLTIRKENRLVAVKYNIVKDFTMKINIIELYVIYFAITENILQWKKIVTCKLVINSIG